MFGTISTTQATRTLTSFLGDLKSWRIGIQPKPRSGVADFRTAWTPYCSVVTSGLVTQHFQYYAGDEDPYLGSGCCDAPVLLVRLLGLPAVVGI
jgi:hypothetical protein